MPPKQAALGLTPTLPATSVRGRRQLAPGLMRLAAEAPPPRAPRPKTRGKSPQHALGHAQPLGAQRRLRTATPHTESVRTRTSRDPAPRHARTQSPGGCDLAWAKLGSQARAPFERPPRIAPGTCHGDAKTNSDRDSRIWPEVPRGILGPKRSGPSRAWSSKNRPDSASLEARGGPLRQAELAPAQVGRLAGSRWQSRSAGARRGRGSMDQLLVLGELHHRLTTTAWTSRLVDAIYRRRGPNRATVKRGATTYAGSRSVPRGRYRAAGFRAEECSGWSSWDWTSRSVARP